MVLSRSAKRYIKYFFLNALVAIAYYATAKFGLALAGSIKQVTLVWPPTGIALASILLWGPGIIPAIAVGAFIANVTTNETPFLALCIALGNTLEAVGGWYLLKKFGFQPLLQSAKSVFLFVILGAAISPMISATIGTSSLILNGIGAWSGYGTVWSTWWLGDMIGAMLVTPLILVWSQTRKMKITSHLTLEALAIVGLLLLTTWLIFFPSLASPANYPLEYLIFPILIWTAFRFRQKGTTLTTILIASVAVWATINGQGPFMVTDDIQRGLITLQFFIGILALTSLVLSSVIEEKSTAQQQLVYSEEKFRALIENSSDVFSLINQDAVVFYTSPSTVKVLGYKPVEFNGTNIFQYIHPDERERLMQLFREILQVPGKTIHTEYRSLTKGGGSKWMEGTGTNLLHEPSVRGIVLNYRDIDERKKLDVVKTEFVTLAAHQLRTPLTTMKWYTEALSDLVKKKTKISEYVNEIYLSIIKMSDLANLMLDVSRIELGTFIKKTESVRLQLLVDTVVQELSLLVSRKKLKLTTTYANRLPPVLTNPKLLRIIIQNLLTNAVHYTPEKGSVTIAIALEEKNLLIQVKDTGIGIPEDAQAKIFTKLFRAGNSKKVMPDGTGLGLYLVKSLVDQEGGKIWFSSQENVGTTFSVSLPIKLQKGGKHGKS